MYLIFIIRTMAPNNVSMPPSRFNLDGTIYKSRVLDFVGNPQTHVMNSVADYKKDGSSNRELVSLRLINNGIHGGIDYHMGTITRLVPTVVRTRFQTL